MSFFDRQDIPAWVLRPSVLGKDSAVAKSLNAAYDSIPKSERKSSVSWRQCKFKKLFHGMLRRKRSAGDRASDNSGSARDNTAGNDGHDDIDGEIRDDLTMLRDYCLIIVNETGVKFEMHGLVQLSTRRWLEACGQLESFKQHYIERLAASFPTGQYENWGTCQSLFAHVQVALDYRPSEDTVTTWATLLHNGGWYAWSQGRYDIAQQMLDMARKTRETRLGKKDVASLQSISMLAQVLLDQGQWEEAEKLEVQVRAIRKTKLGADHPDTLRSMENLALTYWNQGWWDETEKLQIQVIEARKTKLSADHPDSLKSIANLAMTYLNLGRWDEAEKLQVQVMEASKIKLGADHPDTLSSMHNLAFTWRRQGRSTESLQLMRDCVKARQRVLGAGHPDTMSSSAAVAEWE
ncbi:hypothetical protein VTI28DRAFT_3395 [Corynascus sepedonium]